MSWLKRAFEERDGTPSSSRLVAGGSVCTIIVATIASIVAQQWGTVATLCGILAAQAAAQYGSNRWAATKEEEK